MDDKAVADLWKRTHGSIVDDPDAPTAASYRVDATADSVTADGDDRTLDRDVSTPGLQRAKPAAPEPLGDRAGDFELVEEIGRGGMGLVYRAHQKSLDRDVAVKVIRPEHRNARAQERFVSEARVSGALDHPNIVPVHALGETDRGDVFLAMKRVSGRSWKALLHPDKDEDREAAARIDLDGHLAILIAVSNAVAYAHARGIVHRDLKPENVMVGAFGEVMVMDWGIAVDVREPPVKDAAAPHRSTCNGPAGTPCYMSPELVEGRGPDIGPWTDTYLLGAILYEVLVGHAPHKGATLYEVLALARASSPSIPPTVPPALGAIVRRAMAREPADRYGTAPELADALRAYGKVRESDRIAAAARARLDVAEKSAQGSGLYRELGEVASAFAQALLLWPENDAAAQGLRTARLTHARLALSGGDLGLARAELDQLPGDGEAAALLGEVQAAADAQTARARAARRTRGIAAGLAVALFAGLAVGFVWIRAERNEAQAQRTEAEHQRNEAQSRRNEAQEQRDEANRRLAEALVAQGDALAANADWENARLKYEEARDTCLRIGAPVRDAELGLMDLYRRSPRPLLVIGGLAKPLQKPPPGHNASIFCLAFTPDGTTLLSGGGDGHLMAWDPLTGALLRDFATQGQVVRGVVCTAPDRAVTVTDGGHLREWDLVSGKQLRRFDLPVKERTIGMLAWSPATRQLLIPTYSGQIRRVHLDDWKELPHFVHQSRKGKPGLLRAVAPSPDGQRFLSVGMGDNTLAQVFELDPGRDPKYLPDAGKSHWGAAYAPDGLKVALGGEDRAVYVIDPVNGDVLHTLHGHREAVLGVAFDPLGLRLASVARDQTVRLWNPENGTELACFTGHEQYPIAVTFSPDGELLASAGQDATIRIWPARGNPVARPVSARGSTEGIAWAPDGHRVALAAYGTSLVIHDLALDHPVGLYGKNGELQAPIAFSADGQWVYGQGKGGLVRASVSDAKRIETVAPIAKDVKAVALTPDARLIATVRAGGEVEVKEVARAGLDRALASLDIAAIFAQPSARTTAERRIALSRDGRLVATEEGGEITVRDAQTLRTKWTGKAEPATVLGMRFSPDGKRLFVSGRDRLATLWDVAKGRTERQFVDESGVTWTGAVSPDGALLATGSATSQVFLFDVKTGRRVRALSAHEYMCYGVSWSPDGRFLVTAGAKDGFAWDLHYVRRQREAEAALASGGDAARARYLAMRDVPEAALRLMERIKYEGPERAPVTKQARWLQRLRTPIAPPKLDPRTQYAKAVELLEKGDAKGAEAILEKLDKSDGMAQFQLGKARFALDKRTEARAALDEAVRLMPEFSTAWTVRATVRGKYGDDAGALEDLKKAIELDPKSSHALSTLARQHGQMKRWTEAVDAWTRAIALEPQAPIFVWERAKAHAALRNIPQVVADCELLVKIAPKAARARYARGEAYEIAGRLDDALKDYDAALEIDPNLIEVKKARERVAKRKAAAPSRTPTDTR